LLYSSHLLDQNLSLALGKNASKGVSDFFVTNRVVWGLFI
jgi:hypothetical protein